MITVYKIYADDVLECYYQSKHWVNSAIAAGSTCVAYHPEPWEFAEKDGEWKRFENYIEAIDFVGVTYEEYKAGKRSGTSGWRFLCEDSPELNCHVEDL